MITLWVSLAMAAVDPDCRGRVPVPYREQVQSDFMQNYFGLASTFSPIHGPIPHDPGRGALSLDLVGVPPLACRRRFALNASKTEDTNKLPVVPRPRLSFTVPLGKTMVSGGLAYVPPIRFAGQRSTLLSAEVGLGWTLSEHFQLGGRFHATAQKTITDFASALEADAPVADDLFLANSFGLDLLAGFPVGPVTPFVAAGVTDVSTITWIGDDGIMASNLHPYFGPTASVGVEGLVKRFRWGGEFYAAPGGHVRPDKSYPNEVGFGGYGRLYTARLRVGVELGKPR